jgi:late competence protein required for DNA uptake (superfamily II DNA/RNA helicase)
MVNKTKPDRSKLEVKVLERERRKPLLIPKERWFDNFKEEIVKNNKSIN